MMGKTSPYKVVRSELHRIKLLEWIEKAADLDKRKAFVEILQEVERRLKFDPSVWGDPIFDLRKLQLQVFRGIHKCFVVEFGVHEEQRIVFIRSYALIAGHPEGV